MGGGLVFGVLWYCFVFQFWFCLFGFCGLWVGFFVVVLLGFFFFKKLGLFIVLDVEDIKILKH